VIRNWLTFGRPMISSVFEVNIALVTAPTTLAAAQGIAVSPFDEYSLHQHVLILNQAEARHGFWFAEERSWPPPLDDLRRRQVAAIAMEIVRAHPVEAVQTHLEGTRNTWNADSYRYWYERMTGRPWEGIAVSKAKAKVKEAHTFQGRRDVAREVVLGAVGIGVAAGFLLAWKLTAVLLVLTGITGIFALRGEKAFVATVLVTLLYGTLLPGPLGMERFAMPFVPCVAILAGVGTMQLARLGARQVGRISWPTLPRPLVMRRESSAS
jgi:hypothetical protein